MHGKCAPGGCCDPEEIFELVEGTLEPEERRLIRAHLETCTNCRDRYEREVSLNAGLCSGTPGNPQAGGATNCIASVSREVALRIPTRSRLARLMWGMLAIGILITTTLALGFGGDNPIFMATGGTQTVLDYVSAVSDVSALLLALIAPFVLIALAVGFLVDLVIAGIVFSALRRRAVRPSEHARGA